MNPSNFLKHPYDSVFSNMETEIVARNIMAILDRTGNQWREITYAEYEQERLKDGNFSHKEQALFEKVKRFCVSETAAQAFSPAWR